MEGKLRLGLLQRALKKRSPVRRKWPVTAKMMRWIRGQLDLDKSDDRVVWMSLNLGWFFLMRLSEYAAHDGNDHDMAKALLGESIGFRLDGKVVLSGKLADELGIAFRSSKADIFNAGELRNHFRAEDADFCVVEAVAMVQERFPERFGDGREATLPICRFANGSPVFRSQLQVWIARAAREEGYDTDRFGSHSLRIGGATALYHAGVSVEIIKRVGRWASDAFHGYLWESSDNARGLSSKMAADKSSLMVTRGR